MIFTHAAFLADLSLKHQEESQLTCATKSRERNKPVPQEQRTLRWFWVIEMSENKHVHIWSKLQGRLKFHYNSSPICCRWGVYSRMSRWAITVRMCLPGRIGGPANDFIHDIFKSDDKHEMGGTASPCFDANERRNSNCRVERFKRCGITMGQCIRKGFERLQVRSSAEVQKRLTMWDKQGRKTKEKK